MAMFAPPGRSCPSQTTSTDVPNAGLAPLTSRTNPQSAISDVRASPDPFDSSADAVATTVPPIRAITRHGVNGACELRAQPRIS